MIDTRSVTLTKKEMVFLNLKAIIVAPLGDDEYIKFLRGILTKQLKFESVSVFFSYENFVKLISKNSIYYDLVIIDIALNNCEQNWWDCLSYEGTKIKSILPIYRLNRNLEEAIKRLSDQKVDAQSIRDALSCAVCMDSINPHFLKNLITIKLQRDELRQKNNNMTQIIKESDKRFVVLEDELNKLIRESNARDEDRKKELNLIKSLISTAITNSGTQSNLLEQALQKIDQNDSKEVIVQLLQKVLDINKNVQSDIGIAVDLCQENKVADIETALKYAASQVEKSYTSQLTFDFSRIPPTKLSGSQLLLNELLAKFYLQYFGNAKCEKINKMIDIHVNNMFQEHAILIFSLNAETEIFFESNVVFSDYYNRFKSYDLKSDYDSKANIQKVTFFIKK